MAFLYIAILVFVLLITCIKYRSILKLNVIYTALWCFGGIVCSTGFAGLFSLSNNTHFCIILSLLIFNVAYCLLTKNANYYKKRYIFGLDISNTAYRIIIILHLISFAFMAPLLGRAITIISSEGWFSLRNYAYSESALASQLQIYIYTYLINPLYTSTMIIASVLFSFNKNKKSKMLLFLSLADALLITLIFGGRFNLFKLFMFFVIASVLKRFVFKIKFKRKLLMAIILFATIPAFAFLTSLRGIKGLNFFENTVVYFFGSFVYFDLLIGQTHTLNTGLMYGNATFGFITSIPMYVFYQITGNNLTPETLIDAESNEFLYISSSYRYNAFTTWLFPFWKDFGVLGVVIGVAFIVCFFVILKNIICRRKSFFSFSLYIYLVFVVCTSTLTYNLITIQHSMLIVFLFLLTLGGKKGFTSDENKTIRV